jgi:hypothetical protein
MMDWNKVDKLIDAGFISQRKHPKNDLYIYNYTHKTQIEGEWNKETIACRGLIADNHRRILARPFKKFFSLDQMEGLKNHVHHLFGFRWKTLKDLSFNAYEKSDGSLGVTYINPYTNTLELATRGSFESEQAIKANEIWQEKYSDIVIDPEYTALFEIIYPENRIVVNYGDLRDLVLLGFVRISDGVEPPREEWTNLVSDLGRFTSVEHYADIKNLENLISLDNDPRFKDKEGVVLHFENGFRLKHKTTDYKNLHKTLSKFSRKEILQHLVDDSLDKYLELLPDEFYKQAKEWEAEFSQNYLDIETKAAILYQLVLFRLAANQSRKEIALYIKNEPRIIQSLIFSLLDRKPYKNLIWTHLLREYKEQEKKSNG